jgi:hypothetical protein
LRQTAGSARGAFGRRLPHPAEATWFRSLSQHKEKEVQSSFRALQAKYPKLLGGREPMVRRADLGAKGVYYRAMVSPFVSAEQANELCSNLKAAGASCIVQKN